MPNGRMTNRDYLVQIHERVNNIKDDVKENKTAIENNRKSIESHIANHKWLYMAGAGMPPAVYYIIRLIEKVAQ
jgi:hypothetical protein